MSAKNRIVLITGAAGRLGAAVASRFTHLGGRLVLVDRQKEAVESLGKALPGSVVVATDLLDPAQAKAAIGAALQEVGRFDVLCHLAGGFRMGEAVHETTDSTWNFLFDINGRMLVNVARAVVPQMIENRGGKIVTVGSFAGQAGQARMGAYCASKSSVIRLTEAMSAELREHRINVNCVLPTTLDTPENRAAMPDADPARWVSTEDVAEVIAFLSSDSARAIHGAAVPVTGLN